MLPVGLALLPLSLGGLRSKIIPGPQPSKWFSAPKGSRKTVTKTGAYDPSFLQGTIILPH